MLYIVLFIKEKKKTGTNSFPANFKYIDEKRYWKRVKNIFLAVNHNQKKLLEKKKFKITLLGFYSKFVKKNYNSKYIAACCI